MSEVSDASAERAPAAVETKESGQEDNKKVSIKAVASREPAGATDTGSAAVEEADVGAGEVAESGPACQWSFEPDPTPLAYFSSKETKDYLEKWGLDKWAYAQRYRFAGPWNDREAGEFLTSFLNSSAAQGHVRVATKQSLVPLRGRVEDIKYSALRTTVTNMNFFDRLTTEGIVRASGSINRMFEEDFDDVTVSDHLREMLVNEDSEHAYVYADEEKEEFLFHLLKLLAVGGTMMQYEDDVSPYLDCAKGIYKDFLTVYRNSGSGRVAIANHVYRVHSVGDHISLFPTQSDHNMCLLSVDPIKKLVIVLYSARVPYW